MRPLKLYRVESSGHSVIHIAARTYDQAAEIFVSWEAASGLIAETFSVELVSLDDLSEPDVRKLREILATSTEGLARQDEDEGWSINTEGWISFAATDEGGR